MRVLHLDSGRSMGGGQWQVLRLVEGLTARGVECRLLARAGSPLFAEAVRREWSVGAVGWRRVAAECRSAEVVHAHDARTHTMAAICGAPRLVASRRVAFPVRSAWKYGRTARVICVSRYVAGIVEAAGVAKERIRVIYDGVPLLAPSASRTGVVCTSKGGELAARACALVGVEPSFSDRLEHDLPGAAAMLYVSFCEGLGSGALLALAAGVPVAASRVGGLCEAVRDGETGLLAENTAEALASALRAVLARPEMGVAARRDAAERFGVERMVEETMTVYREVVE
jgi:glycosyltransferase involved in cell wall biosynthesis